MEADELFVLHCYLLGGMEKVYERIETGMTLSVDHLVELLEFAMPEKSRRWFWASRKLPATGHKRDRKISFVRRVIAENFVGIFVHKYVKKISNDL